MRELNKKIAALLFCAAISIGSSGCDISDYDNNHAETVSSTILNDIESYEGDQQETILIENNSEHQLAAENNTYQEFSLRDIPDYNDKPYVAVNDNIPFFNGSELTTKSFESYSDLDDLGRCGIAYACIGKDIMPTEERGNIGSIKPTGWQTIKYDNVDGKYLYNRCHLIGYQLSGENANEKNLITGTRYLNVDGMLPFENMTTDYINETENHVLYRVTPIFDGDNLLASGVLMEGYSVEDNGAGICFNVFCYNVQPDITINYVNGDSEANVTISTTATTQVTTTTTPTTTTVTTTTTPTTTTVITTTPTTTTVTTTQTTKSKGTNYILNTNTKKFHYPGCSSVKQMKESNKKEYTGDRSDVISQGYDPCKRCNP